MVKTEKWKQTNKTQHTFKTKQQKPHQKLMLISVAPERYVDPAPHVSPVHLIKQQLRKKF